MQILEYRIRTILGGQDIFNKKGRFWNSTWDKNRYLVLDYPVFWKMIEMKTNSNQVCNLGNFDNVGPVQVSQGPVS